MATLFHSATDNEEEHFFQRMQRLLETGVSFVYCTNLSVERWELPASTTCLNPCPVWAALPRKEYLLSFIQRHYVCWLWPLKVLPGWFSTNFLRSLLGQRGQVVAYWFNCWQKDGLSRDISRVTLLIHVLLSGLIWQGCLCAVLTCVVFPLLDGNYQEIVCQLNYLSHLGIHSWGCHASNWSEEV